MAKKRTIGRPWGPPKPARKPGRTVVPRNDVGLADYYEPLTTAPPGTYDPALDAQGDNAALGALWSTEDYGRDTGRLVSNRDISLEQIGHQFDTANRDLTLQQTRGEEDYGRGLAGLTRQYGILANRQRQQAARAGVAEGGALVQAMRKRGENMAWDRQGLDRNHDRFNENIKTRQGDLGWQRDHQAGQVELGFKRGNEDLTTNWSRGQTQNTLFGQQLNTQKLWQAGQAGLLPEGPVQQTVTHKGSTYQKRPDGTLVAVKKKKKPAPFNNRFAWGGGN